LAPEVISVMLSEIAVTGSEIVQGTLSPGQLMSG